METNNQYNYMAFWGVPLHSHDIIFIDATPQHIHPGNLVVRP